MKVYGQGNKINVYGDIHVADLTKFFGQHEVLTDPSANGACACGYEYRDWPEHATEEFIAWMKSL